MSGQLTEEKNTSSSQETLRIITVLVSTQENIHMHTTYTKGKKERGERGKRRSREGDRGERERGRD